MLQPVNNIPTPAAAQGELDYNAILLNYGQALASVNNKYTQRVLSQIELMWYQNYLNQADQLATEYGLEKISNTPARPIPSTLTLDRNQAEKVMNGGRLKLQNYQNLRNKFQSSLEAIEKEFKEKIDNLRKNLESLVTEISKVNNRIDELKTSRMVEILLIMGGGMLVAFFSKNLIATVAAMGVIWLVRAVADGLEQ